ncbi:MAG TPA: hypothetical protein VHY58_04250 [Streptosporangiaceae bacterium]|jgi:hypothetical protein|nr:hypothetical protein [Streptosporangiaceae bacterium]
MIPTAIRDARMTRVSALPVIDPQSLTPSQRAGRRCAVPNCRRLLADLVYKVGRLPGGKPVVVCEECAPMIRLAPSAQAA